MKIQCLVLLMNLFIPFKITQLEHVVILVCDSWPNQMSEMREKKNVIIKPYNGLDDVLWL